MSRIRSQLETIRRSQQGGDDRYERSVRQDEPEGRRAQSDGAFPRQGDSRSNAIAELDRIKDRLARLGAAAPAPAPRPAGEGAQRRPSESPAPRAMARPEAPQAQRMPAVAPSGEVESLRREIADIKNMLAGLARSGASPELAADLRRIADGVAQMRQPASNGHLEEIAAELHDLRSEMRQIGSTARPSVDPAELLRSIEDGYATIAGRLEEALSRHAAPAPVSPAITALSDHVSALRDLVEQLPFRLPVEAVEARLDELGEGIARLSGSGEDGFGRHFRTIENKLEEVTRALVAVSVSPVPDLDALDRIEARIANLSQSIGEIGSGGAGEDRFALAEAATQALDAVTAQIADLSTRVEQIYEIAAAGPVPEEGLQAVQAQLFAIEDRIAQMESGGAAAIDLAPFKAIIRQVSELSARLDSFQASGGNSGQALSAPNRDEEILAAIDIIAQRLESMPAGGDPASADASLFLSLEQRMDDVSRQIASLQPAAGAFGNPTGLLDQGESRHEELLAAIDQLSSRMSHAGQDRSDPFEENERLASLEHTLDRIASRLDGPSQPQGDFGIIAERLDSIEQQVAMSRDFALEAANIAAERVLQMAGQMSAQTYGGMHQADPALVDSIASELRGLEALVRDVSMRSDDGFNAVRGVLDTVVTRLDEMEAGIGSLPPASGRSHEHAHAANRGYAAEGSAGLGEFGSSLMDGPAAQISREAPEPRLQDDVPLEPGSGMPDLAALVRDASERRRSQAEASAAPAGDDFLAAARRAAQQQSAAAPAAAASKKAPRQDKAPAAKSPAGKSAVAGLFAGKRKLLLGAVAATAILALAVPFAMKMVLGGGGQEISQELEQAPATEQSGDATGQLAAAGSPTGEETVAGDVADSQDDPIELGAAANDGAADADAPAGGAIAPVETLSAEAITAAPVPPEEVGNVPLREAAATGNADALFEIARRYTDGEGVGRDLAKAAEWYEQAARAGSAPAQYRLANFLEKGHGVTVDVERAALWYQRAAEQGNALAMHNLGVLYASGSLGGSPDLEQALGWFEKAGALGVKDSQVNLGIIYAQGMGVAVDLVQSYKWFAVAARGGDSDAGAKRDAVAKGMRPEQLEKGRAEAEAWKPGELDPSANAPSVLPEWTAGGGQKADVAPTGSVAAPGPALSQREILAKVQGMLTQMGFDAGPADGMMGARTREAIRQAQKQFGMAADGQITAEFLERLAGAV